MTRSFSTALLVAVLFSSATSARLQPAPSAVAFTHVAVVDPGGTATQWDRTVVVTGERIAQIGQTGEVSIPSGARVIDATGRYLIPGLWDMHAHVFTHRGDAFFPLYAVAGVTGVRDMHTAVPIAEIQEHRRRLAAGTLIGPRLLAVAGPLIAGPSGEGRFPAECVVSTPAEARAAVLARKRMGVDFIKVHGGLSQDLLLAIVDEARQQGLPVLGHAPGRPEDASDAGLRSIEHNTGVRMSGSPDAAALRKQNAAATPAPDVGFVIQNVRRRARARFDEQTAQPLFAKFRANDTWLVPTLVQGLVWQYLADGTVPYPDWLRYMPRSFTSTWKNSPGFQNPSAQDLADGHNDLRIAIEIVGAMRRAGLKLMAGTDANGPFPALIPGISLHEELRLFVEAGYTPAEALRAATLVPAQFLGRERDFGTVAAGKVADLVLLDADPLVDIRNTQKIGAVLLNGRLLDRKALDDLRSRLERAAPNQ
jgi:imidazolonepropionase-like amidohydrolase